MHTLYVIAGGLLLLGIFVLFARALSDVHRGARGKLLLAFIPVWLTCAAFNMWVGVSRAGYIAWAMSCRSSWSCSRCRPQSRSGCGGAWCAAVEVRKLSRA
jgi:hypothetical protein